MAPEITRLTIVYLAVYSGTNQRKHQTSVSVAFVRGIQRWPVNSPHKGPVTQIMFPFDDVSCPQNLLGAEYRSVSTFSMLSCEISFVCPHHEFPHVRFRFPVSYVTRTYVLLCLVFPTPTVKYEYYMMHLLWGESGLSTHRDHCGLYIVSIFCVIATTHIIGYRNVSYFPINCRWI